MEQILGPKKIAILVFLPETKCLITYLKLQEEYLIYFILNKQGFYYSFANPKNKEIRC